MSSASATIEVHSLTHPDEAPTTMTTGVNDTFSHYLAIQSFLACTTDPCSEDYEVVVQCKPAASLPQIDVSGDISSFGRPAVDRERFASAGCVDAGRAPSVRSQTASVWSAHNL
jgi:hypothetical protein